MTRMLYIFLSLLAVAGLIEFAQAEENGVAPVQSELARFRAASDSEFFINLGDYAKGDGTDETAAIQRAVNAIPPIDSNSTTQDHPGGVLFIPRPKVCYAISDTIVIREKWNVKIVCESPVWGSRGMPTNQYFRWIGPDNGVMFRFDSCKGMTVENLSMTALDELCISDKRMERYNFKPIGRRTRGVTGVQIGPETTMAGFQTNMIFDHLHIRDADVGIRIGGFANNGPDIRELTFRNLAIPTFASYGVIAASGNLATVTFQTVATGTFYTNGKAAFRIDGGELLITNWGGAGHGVDPNGAEVVVNAGGVHIIKAWSEWTGPFLRANNPQPPEWTDSTWGSVNYPMILEGVRHYCGIWMDEHYTQKKNNPVPLSIVYDNPAPLHLMGCSLWGGVELGAKAESTLIDQGTVFVDKNSIGFVGEGVERYGRAIHIGTRNSENGRILQPYVVDRRNTPGTAPPAKGVWQKGDAILNTDPDPKRAQKAWRGWICIEAGEPGKWAPFGAIAK